jgi:formylglycine-generating enzyme required for sulfatase activity
MVTDTLEAWSHKSKANVFISYSQKDMTFADRLESALKSRGLEPLIDRSKIYAFEDWWRRIQDLIGKADTIIFVLSPDSVKSDVCAREVSYAASLNKRFAPIVYRRVDDTAIPAPLRKLHFIFFDDPERFDASADLLAEALQTDIGWIREHTEYGEAARRWAAANRSSGLLLHSPVLEVAEHWIASRPRNAPEPTKDTQEFIAASRNGARTAQRLRRIALTFIFALLVGIILGLIGWINQEYLKEEWRWYATIQPFKTAKVEPFVLTAQSESTLSPLSSFKECAEDVSCPEMIVAPAGQFLMGSEQLGAAGAVEGGAVSAAEGPPHKVIFANPFAVSRFEVTLEEWRVCVSYGDCVLRIGNNTWEGERQPVIEVTWNDAQRYVAWLSRMTGRTYRLLSEAEWEYAARAGTTTAYSFGDDPAGLGEYAWYLSNSALQTHPVGQKKANPWGLFDIHGNVREWIEDCFHKDYAGAPTDGSAWTTGGDCSMRMIRGGSWRGQAPMLSSAHRVGSPVELRNGGTGVRIARTLVTTAVANGAKSAGH